MTSDDEISVQPYTPPLELASVLRPVAKRHFVDLHLGPDSGHSENRIADDHQSPTSRKREASVAPEIAEPHFRRADD